MSNTISTKKQVVVRYLADKSVNKYYQALDNSNFTDLSRDEQIRIEKSIPSSNHKKKVRFDDGKLYYSVAIPKIIPKFKAGVPEHQKNSARETATYDDSIIELHKEVTHEWHWIPRMSERNDVLREFHGSHHVGTKKMQSVMHRGLTGWARMQSDVERFCRTCPQCQTVKSDKSVVLLQPVIADYPLHHLYIDITFMQRENGKIGMVCLIDHHTKLLKSRCISSKRAEVVVGFLTEVFDSFGMSELKGDEKPKFQIYLRSDNGKEFVAKLVEDVCQKYGVLKKEGPAYSPWVQGVVERVQKTVKDRMKNAVINNDSDWVKEHDNAIELYNNTVHSTTGMTPNEAWARTFVLNEITLSEEAAAMRLYTIGVIKSKTLARGEADAARRAGRKRVKFLSKDTVVLVRVPMKYRANKRLVWGKKAKLVEQRTAGNKRVSSWKVEWLETGGIKSCERTGDVTPYWLQAQHLKVFQFGFDKYLDSRNTEPVTTDNLQLQAARMSWQPKYTEADKEGENDDPIADQHKEVEQTPSSPTIGPSPPATPEQFSHNIQDDDPSEPFSALEPAPTTDDPRPEQTPEPSPTVDPPDTTQAIQEPLTTVIISRKNRLSRRRRRAESDAEEPRNKKKRDN